TSRKRSFPKSPNDYVYFTNFLRFRADGTLDPEFSDDGIVSFENAGVFTIDGLYVYSNGQILISDPLGLKRYNADGSPDSTFQFDPSYNGYLDITCMAVPRNEKILVVGFKRAASGPGAPFLGSVRRFWADGTPDIKFGQHGEGLFTA